MKKRNLCLVLLFIPLIVFAVDYYYVDVEGSDVGGDGSEGDPWATIQHAVDNVIDPDDNDIVIYISVGTFNLWDGSTTQTIVVNRPFQDLTLQGAGAQETIIQGHTIQGSADGRVFYFTDTWGDIAIRDVTIRHGNTSGGGGGIYSKEVWSLVIENCNIAYNHADDRGGGIQNGYRGGMSIFYSTIHHNTTDGDGGGISNYESVHVSYSPLLDIRNSTISHNTAADQGGGISAYSTASSSPGSRLHICNATISQNESGNQGGGIYYGPYSSARLKNTIVGNNDSDSDEGDDVYFYPPDEDMVDYGYNIIEYSDGYDFSGEASNYTGPQVSLNLSSTLDANFTTEGTYTLEITSGSIAVDNGDDTQIPAWGVGYSRDQRAASRNGDVDIGAYEWWADSGDYPKEPSNHVLDFSADAQVDITIDLTWTENDGDVPSDGYLILASTGGISPPDDGTEPVDDTDLTDGDGNVMVADETTSYTFSNCSSETTYNFRIYPFTDSFDYINYKTDSGFGYDDATTGDLPEGEPTNHVTGFTAERDAINVLNEIDNLWTDSAGGQLPDSYLIKVSDTSFDDISTPVDGVAEPDDTDFADGTGTVNIAHGTRGSYTWNTLSEGTTYYFKIFPYTNSGVYVNYKTDGVVPSDNAITASTPNIGDLIITEIVGDAVSPANPNTGFIEFLNISGTLLDLSSVQVNYYNDGADAPTATMTLFGGIGIDEYKIICQEQGNFMMFYGFDAHFQAPFNWGTMTSEFPLDGGDDSVVITIPDGRATIDRFNDPADPWSWDSSIVYERNTTTSGSSQSNWSNPGGTGTPGAGGDIPLPVALSTFYVSFVDETLTLYWTTEWEENNAEWNIYRGTESNAMQNETTIKLNTEIISGAGTTNSLTEYEYIDNQVLAGSTYWYWLESIDIDGESEIHSPTYINIPNDNSPTVPFKYGLQQNFPNPFNPFTTIEFALDNDDNVELSIYNTKGELVKTIYKDFVEADKKVNLNWNGTDSNNKKVSSGIYFYKLETSEKDFLRKMILIK